MFVETFAGSLEVILGYFIIVPLIVRLVSSVIGVESSVSGMEKVVSLKALSLILFPRSLGCILAMNNYQLKIKTYFAENSSVFVMVFI